MRWREGSRLMHKLSAHKARMQVLGYFLHLSAASTVSGGDGGVQYRALYALCVERRNEVSPRVLKTMLALLRLAGFVESWRGAADRRISYYRPTPRMFEHARLAYGYSAAALDVLEPRAGRHARLASDMAYLQRMLVTAGRAHAEDPPDRHSPDFIDFIGNREGSGPLLACLLLAELEGAPVPSRATMAARFGLSKSQVGQVLAQGARRGYVSLKSSATPVVTPLLAATFRDWIGIELAFHARHMRAA